MTYRYAFTAIAVYVHCHSLLPGALRLGILRKSRLVGCASLMREVRWQDVHKNQKKYSVHSDLFYQS